VTAPTGTVTFLFTDLEGSTRLWEEHPAAMHGALARHDDLLRAAIEQHGGHVVKTTGDGVHGAFAAPADALAAAVGGQRALAAEPWGETGSLRVRMGIHSGAAEARAGDYYGPTLNRAARLMSVAHGGQVVLSQTTQELLAGSLPDGVRLLDLGEHRLRDLTSNIGVFQVVLRDLPSEFPPLRSLESAAGNLPLQLTSFVGREAEVRTVGGALGEARLVTLTGTGGVGKTRLALQGAAELLPEYGDGAWLCELAPVTDADAMAQVIASTLGAGHRPGLSLSDSVIEYLRYRQLLLILDNCEHLLDDAGAFAERVLQRCGDVTILATSREALDVAGERVVRVRSLSTPDGSATDDDLRQNASVRLFVDRASAVASGFELTSANRDAVADICRRLDGIPLALELAAARIAAMSPKDVANRLDERFRLLTGQRRGRVERHQTLRATVEWSYQLLLESERNVFHGLSVFAGTFDADAVVAVVADGGTDGWEVLDTLAGLVAKSMLVSEEAFDGSTRYVMLETLRQFAHERLDETGEADRLRRRHAGYYADLMTAVGVGLRGPDELEWRLRREADLDNMRAALDWGLDSDEPEDRQLAVRISAGVAHDSLGYRTAGMRFWSVLAVAAAEEVDPARRVSVLSNASFHATDIGNQEEARSLAAQALALGVDAEHPPVTIAFQALAYVDILSGNYDSALGALRAAVERLERIDAEPWELGHVLANLGCYEAINGELEVASEHGRRALTIARELGCPSLLAFALHTSAWTLISSDREGALAATEEAIALSGDGDVASGTLSGTYSMCGLLRAYRGNLAGAYRALRKAVLLSRDYGERPQMGAALGWGIAVFQIAGRPEQAAVFVGALNSGALRAVSNHPRAARGHGPRRVEQLRAVLGDDVDVGMARGAAMSYDEIVEYVLAELDAAEAAVT
jgi:predicted ATPase/class 3 adenylate cyclase